MAKLYGEIAAKSLLTLDKSFARANGQPLDASEVYYSLAAAQTYAATAQAYIGQKIVVVENNVVTHYSVVDADGTLKELGSKPVGDNHSIEVSETGVVSIKDFGTGYYKYIPKAFDEETGEQIEGTGEYEATLTEGFAENLTPKVKLAEGGGYEIAWYAPNTDTTEGVLDTVTGLTQSVDTLNKDVDDVQNEVVDLQESIYGEGGTAEAPAKGSIAANVKDLVDTVGGEDDELGEDVNTLWANVNDLDDRVSTIEGDYVKAADLNEVRNIADAAQTVDEVSDAIDAKIEGLDLANTYDAKGAAAQALIDAKAHTDAEIDSLTVAIELKESVEYIVLKDKEGNEIASANASKFVQDSFLDDVSYNAETGKIAFTWTMGDGSTKTDEVNVADFVETYTAGNGLTLANNEFAVDTNVIATVDALNGVEEKAQKGIDDAAAAQKAIDDYADAHADDYDNDAINKAISDAIDGLDIETYAKASEVVANTVFEQFQEDNEAAIADAAESAVSDAVAQVENKGYAVATEVAETYATKEELAPVTTTANNASTKVNQLEGRLNDLVAEGGEPNAINTIKRNGVILNIAEDKSVDISVPTKFSDLTDDSGFDERITAAQNQADEGVNKANAAQTTANEAKSAAETNATNIGTLNTTVAGHTATLGEHTTEIANLKQADQTHAAEFNSLKSTVEDHTTAIAGKAEQTALDAAVANITKNTTAITTLNETTIPAINTEIGKKANALDVHDKATVEGLIATAKQEAIDEAEYDDSEVRGLIAANAEAISKLDETYATDAELAAAVEELEGKIDGITVPVTSVTGDDRVISVVNTEGVHKVSATLGLKYTAATADANAKIELVGINDTVLGTIDASDFVKDGMLESVTKNETDNTITFTWNTDAGKQTTTIDIDELVEVYTAGNGIDITNYAVSIKRDQTSEDFLTVGQNGIKLAGVQAAIEEAKQDAIDDADGKLAAAKEELEGKITAVDQDFVKEVQINGTALPATDKKVNIPVALASALGVVKGSADAVQTEGVWSGENKIMVAEDGTMEVNKVNVNKLVQNEGDVLILNGGNALV